MKTFKIIGDFSAEQALMYKNELNKFADETQDLFVDLQYVTHADIVAVNALVSTHKILAEKGGSFKLLISPNSEISKMLHLTKFIEILQILS